MGSYCRLFINNAQLVSVYLQDPVFYKLIVDKIKTEGGGFKALKKLRGADLSEGRHETYSD